MTIAIDTPTIILCGADIVEKRSKNLKDRLIMIDGEENQSKLIVIEIKEKESRERLNERLKDRELMMNGTGNNKLHIISSKITTGEGIVFGLLTLFHIMVFKILDI